MIVQMVLAAIFPRLQKIPRLELPLLLPTVRVRDLKYRRD